MQRAGPRAAGSVLASDAFFPKPDGVEVAIQAGVQAIVQPGGSVRDADVIAAANLVDICGIVVTQGKTPAEDVVKMAEKAEIPIFTTGMTRWQVATRLYEAGVR